MFDYKSTDYKKWAKGLKKAGYATSKTYATRLITIIENNKLYRYDSGKAVNNESIADKKQKKKKKKINIRKTKEGYAVQLGRIIKENNRVKYIEAKNGDTYLKLTEEFNMLRFELYKYNDLKKGAKLQKGQVVYLQPKRNKSEKGKEYLTVKAGDTPWSISQKYAVKLRKIMKRNQLLEEKKLKVGSKIELR